MSPTIDTLVAAGEDTGTIAARYDAVRGATMRFAAPLSADDCQAQSMTEASPVKWHLAHTTWFFETFCLSEHVPGYRPFHEDYRYLFNSYYNAVSDLFSRPDRGLLTRPSLDEVKAFRAHVDRGMGEWLRSGDVPAAVLPVIELGLNHEQQHQELMVTDFKHLLSINPLRHAYHQVADAPSGDPGPMVWCEYDEGVDRIGHDGIGFTLDNERPRHRVFLEGFRLANRLVTNGEYREFMDDGGYSRPELWLSDGWAKVQQAAWAAPMYWVRGDRDWEVWDLGSVGSVRQAEPVCHLSFYEADAYARWAEARLPTEAEWEVAAADLPRSGNFVERGRLHPEPLHEPKTGGPNQMFGDVWEWTQSPYGPYPGYTPARGALGEYNGKFMANQVVLRGGSCATSETHIRATYRNFFYPDARWQFAGVRLARDLS